MEEMHGKYVVERCCDRRTECEKMGISNSLWEVAANKAIKMLSHLLGPVAPDFELKEEDKMPVVDEHPQSYYNDIVLPKQPFNRFSEQEKLDIFEKFTVKYKKVYLTEEEKLRRYLRFKKTMAYIDKVCDGLSPCGLGLNQYSHLTDEEYYNEVGIIREKIWDFEKL